VVKLAPTDHLFKPLKLTDIGRLVDETATLVLGARRFQTSVERFQMRAPWLCRLQVLPKPLQIIKVGTRYRNTVDQMRRSAHFDAILDHSFQKRYNGAMARTKEFDQEQALDAAMHLFWERGYEATSIQELVDATGVQRQSLYDTFGSKHEMFLQSLMRYQALEGHQLSELTKKHPKGGLPLIRAIFESCASQTVCDARGCFAANCAAELGSSDEAVAERVRIGREGLEEVFKRCLVQAKRRSRTQEFIFCFCVGAVPGQCFFRSSPHGEDATHQSNDR
jgi:TetR/AcrR family transcriptional repressor of nem operon